MPSQGNRAALLGTGWRCSGKGAALLVLAGLLTGCTASPEPADSTSPPMPSGAFSTLDVAGLKQIRAGKAARLDMTSGTLRKADMRLADDGYPPEINTRDSGKISLAIMGPAGEVSGETDRVRFNTTATRPDFSEVTYFLSTNSREEYFELIRDGVERFGIDRDAAERWISSPEGDPEFDSDHSLPPGFDT